MKKILTTSILAGILIGSSVFATPNQEAMDSLDLAKKHISKERYDKAMDEIDYAVSKINELLAEKLKGYIPEAISGYTIKEKSTQGLGDAGVIMGSKNSITALGVYEGKNGSNVEVSITSGGFIGKAAGLMSMAGLFAAAENNGGMTKKTVRINGYTGNLEEDGANNSATLSFQIGEKTSVIIKGENLKSKEDVSKFAKKIDFDGIEESF